VTADRDRDYQVHQGEEGKTTKQFDGRFDPFVGGPVRYQLDELVRDDVNDRA
jgi:hypothetical protein